MKKIYSTLASVVMGAAFAFAGSPIDCISAIEVSDEAVESEVVTDFTTATPRSHVPRKVSSVSDVVGTYIITNSNPYDASLKNSIYMTISETDTENKVLIEFPAYASLGVTGVEATVDITNGTITVAAGTVSGQNSSGYDLLFYPAAAKTYFSATNYVFNIGADGSLTLPIICSTTGAYSTGFGFYYKKGSSTYGPAKILDIVSINKANATLSYTYTTDQTSEEPEFTPISVPVYAEYTGNRTTGGTLHVSSVCYDGLGCPVDITLAADGTLAIIDQLALFTTSSQSSTGKIELKVETYPQLVANVTGTYSEDLKTIKWNGENYWTNKDNVTNYWEGYNTEATLTIDNVIDKRFDGPDAALVSTEKYISFAKSGFTSYNQNIAITHPVIIYFYDDNSIELEGMGGMSKFNTSTAYSNFQNVKGTYDPTTETISIPSNQVVCNVTSGGTIYDVVTLYRDKSTGSINSSLPIVLSKDEDGNWAFQCRVYCGYKKSGATSYSNLAYELNPVLKPANGEISFYCNLYGAYSAPFYYEFYRDDEGIEHMRTSGFMVRDVAAYEMTWDIEDNIATASDQLGWIAASKTYYVCSGTKDSGSQVATIAANVSDPDNLVLPLNVDGKTITRWSIIQKPADGNGYYGWCYDTKITGTAKRAPYIRKMYVRGELPGTTDWSAEDAYLMDSEDGLVYTITLPAGTLTNEGEPVAWKIGNADWSQSFGCGITVIPGTMTTYWNGGNNTSNLDGEVTLTLTTTESSWAEGGQAQLKVDFVPETLCVIGQLADGEWNPTVVAPLTKEGKVFSGKVTLAGPHFSLCEKQGEADNWSSIGLRWGAESNDFELAANTPATIVAGNSDNAFKVVTEDTFPIDIDVEVNFEDMTLTLKEVTTGIGVIANEAAPVEYFNLQGIRVVNPAGGIFIMRQGSKAVKVYVK